jgi:uncharacterized protein (TIGR03086 family)
MDEHLMKAVCDASDRVVAGVAPEQFTLPTPCVEWNVRELCNHLLGTLELGRALLSDEAPTVQAGPGDAPPQDLIGDDLVRGYRSRAAALVAATTAGALGRVHVTPLGEMPGMVLGGFIGLDVLVHGWDLARATGQDASLDPGLAEQILGFARQAIGDEMGARAPRIGPKIDVADDADATSRLVAYLGRQP